MRRKVKKVLIFCGFILALTGCGESKNVEQGKRVENEIIETEKVEQSAEVQDLGRNHDFCNNKYLFTEEDISNGCRLTQYRMDGTMVEQHILPEYVEINSVEEDGVYYINYTDDLESEVLYRIPFVKSERLKEKVLDLSKEEEVIVTDECSFLSSVYFIGDYAVFQGGERYFQYNMKKEKYDTTFDHLLYEGFEGYIYAVCGDWVFMFGKEMYQINPKTKQYKKLKYEMGEEDVFCKTEDTLFWAPFFEKTIKKGRVQRYVYDRKLEEGIYRHNVEEGDSQLLVSAKEIQKTIVEEKELGITEKMLDSCEVVTLYYEENRLYAQVQVRWHEEENYYSNYVILSCKDSKKIKLRYEKN